jgi:hypothetical protein
VSVAERRRLEGRVAQLEGALAGYMRVMDLVGFKVEGDLRWDFLEAYAGALAAVPPELHNPLSALGSEAGQKIYEGA